MTELRRTQDRVGEVASALGAVETRVSDGARLAEDEALVAEFRDELTGELATRVSKFERRAVEKDTESGEFTRNTAYREKVRQLAERHKALLDASLELLEALLGAEAKAKEIAKEQRAAEEAAAADRVSAEAQAAEAAEAEAARLREEAARAEEIAKAERVNAAAKIVLDAQHTPEEDCYKRDRKAVDAFMEKRKVGLDAVAAALDLVDDRGAASGAAIKELCTLFERIVAHPEEEPCRTINALNGTFRKLVGDRAGGREFLAAAGFELRFVVEKDDDDVETKHVLYVCPEPDLATDLDKWTAWFDHMKAVLALAEEKKAEHC